MGAPLLTRIKKANIPNSFYIMLVMAIFAVSAVIYGAIILSSKKEVEQETETVAVAQDPFGVSARAQSRIKLDMTRQEVVRVLGEPDWALIPSDKGGFSLPDDSFGLELRWDNPACSEVIVMFSPEPYTVIGWNDGTKFCRPPTPTDRADYLCSNPDRSHLCKNR